MAEPRTDPAAEREERWQLLRRLDRMLEVPLVVLAIVWLGILVLEFAGGADPRLDALFYAIWAVFIAEVVIELVIAPDRVGYLRSNWLKIIALVVPALRVLRVFVALRFLRAARVARSLSLVRLLTSLNRGMAALSRTLDRAKFVYVFALTVLVIIVGAAGMLLFEASADTASGPRLTTYGDALWWTAMLMTTVGTDYFPVTAEGRLLGWGLSLFAIGVFGYVTATMASHFLGIGVDRPAGERDAALTSEIAELRSQITALTLRLGEKTP